MMMYQLTLIIIDVLIIIKKRIQMILFTRTLRERGREGEREREGGIEREREGGRGRERERMEEGRGRKIHVVCVY